MRKISAKTNSSDGIISRHLNRKISIHFSKFLLHVRPEISPNTVSFFCFLLALLGGVFFVFSLPVLGGIIVQLSSIIDGCDGEIARMTNKSSKSGAFLDSVLDRYAEGFILVMIIYYLQIYWSFPEYLILMFIIGVLAIVGSLLISYTATKSTQILPREFSRTIEGHDFRFFILMVGGIAAFFWYFSLFLALLFIACITNFKVGQRIYQLKRALR